MSAFELLALTETQFFSSLANEHCTVESAAQNQVARYLWRYLQDQRATFLVLENDYVDSDYLDDHSAFYARSFVHYRGRTKRLHFFQGHVPHRAEFVAAVLNENDALVSQLCPSYLGFIVARPLPLAIVGRTALKPYPSDNGRRNYPATKTYKVNLFGISLAVQSLAFQQQDRALAACATVALWSCFHKTAELYGTTAPTPSLITRTASVYIQRRPIPSQGLDLQQMCEAVRAVGLEPEVYQPVPGLPLASLVYSYVSMGQPVILGVIIEGLGGHAITVSGFSMTTQRCLEHEAGLGLPASVPLKGQWINELYVHDDQTGPFAKLTLHNPTSPDQTLVMHCGNWLKPDGTPRKIQAFAVLVPVCSAIRIGFSEVAAFTSRVSGLLDTTVGPNAVWDIFLVESNKYKEQLRNSQDTVVPSRADILLASHPRYVWCSRLSSDLGMRLEFLHDATNVYGALPAYTVRWGDVSLRDSIQAKLMAHPALLRTSLGFGLYDWLVEKSADSTSNKNA